MSGRSYTRVELPAETLADIQRKTDQALAGVEAQITRITVGCRQATIAAHVARIPAATAATVAPRADAVARALVELGANDAAAVLQDASAAAQAPRRAARDAGLELGKPHPRAAPEATQASLERYQRAEEAALESLRTTKAERLHRLEVARMIAAHRPSGVRITALQELEDGRVVLRMAHDATRLNVVVAAGTRPGETAIVADAPGRPVVRQVGEGQEAVCAGLDEVFEPLLARAREAGMKVSRTRTLEQPPPAAGRSSRPAGRAQQRGR